MVLIDAQVPQNGGPHVVAQTAVAPAGHDTIQCALQRAVRRQTIAVGLGKGVAETVGSGLVTLPQDVNSLGVVFAGVLGAIVWNLITWWRGLPSSSSHALVGGLFGAILSAYEITDDD